MRREDRGGGERDDRFIEHVVDFWRCAKTVKGGRIFSFSALAIVGDGAGTVGWGYGKAREVPLAAEKALKIARKSMIRVEIDGETIPHEVRGQYGKARVILLPACAGTGIIAGTVVRAVAECLGLRELLSKSYGTSNNAKNLVKATFDALGKIRSRAVVERLRGVKLS